MSVSPILPALEWKDIPDEFLRALNQRFRQLSGSSSETSDGSSVGLFFTHANRPDANGTPVGTFGAETDTGDLLQVQTVGSKQTWVSVTPWLDDGSTITGAEPVHLDTGATPQNSHVVMKANGLGVLSLLCYSADNVIVGMDAEYVGGSWIARNASICLLDKAGAKLNIYGSTGNVVGSAATLTLRATIDLATGDINASTGVYKKGGTQVVTTRQTGPGTASGTLPDVVAKFNLLVAALQTHGLIT